jgi:hypothetical protein
MAPPSKGLDLEVAWRALTSGDGPRDGWRTITVASGGSFPIFAAKFFPGAQEAILIDFGAVPLPPDPQLPHGKGFTVGRVPDAGRPAANLLALRRNPNSSIDLFTVMAEDVVDALLSAPPGRSREKAVQAFLARIQAWQDFMKRGRDRKLAPERELGLVGELFAVRGAVKAGLTPEATLTAWEGPADGLHDLQFGAGALEVKSCIAGRDFPVTISSLQQLDPSLCCPLFLMGLRFALSDRGHTLPQVIDEVRGFLGQEEPECVSLFDLRLLQFGFLPGTEDLYERRFILNEWLVLPVADDFPRLTASTVPMEIRSAQYSLDLHPLRDRAVPLRTALASLGMVLHAA